MTNQWAVVTHVFKAGKGEEYWGRLQSAFETDPGLKGWHETNKAKGFYCHAWMPSKIAVSAKEGSTTCIWEVDEGHALDELQKYLDEDPGNKQSGFDCFNNNVVELDTTMSPPIFPSAFASS